jgi:nucleotide-binding universal stress UspA family protein
MIENILFPVDFSPSCVAIAPYVSRAAAMFGSRITLLHVCDLESHDGFELYVRAPQEIAEDHWTIACRKIESFLSPEFPASTCARIVRCGDAAEQIVDAAVSGRFDLIVMPTHAGRFRRMLLGSTTAKVLDQASCPVLTTEHAENMAPKLAEHPKWLCAIDLDDDAVRVLEVAGRAAATAGARLSLLHVMPGSGDDGRDGHADEADVLRSVQELKRRTGCEGFAQVTRGHVKDAVLQAAEMFNADALILGRRPSEPHGRMRDLTYSLVRDAPCPVLSV